MAFLLLAFLSSTILCNKPKYLEKFMDREGSMWNQDLHHAVEERRHWKAEHPSARANHEKIQASKSDRVDAFNWMFEYENIVDT